MIFISIVLIQFPVVRDFLTSPKLIHVIPSILCNARCKMQVMLCEELALCDSYSIFVKSSDISSHTIRWYTCSPRRYPPLRILSKNLLATTDHGEFWSRSTPHQIMQTFAITTVLHILYVGTLYVKKSHSTETS